MQSITPGRPAQEREATPRAQRLPSVAGLSGAAAVLWYAVDTVQKYRLEVSVVLGRRCEMCT